MWLLIFVVIAIFWLYQRRTIKRRTRANNRPLDHAPTTFREGGGMIAYLGLQEFWNSLTNSEQSALTRYYRAAHGEKTNPAKGDITYTNQTPLRYLTSAIGWAVNDKKFLLAEKMIRYGERCGATSTEMHFFYDAAIKCYYKQRETDKNALSKAIAYCKADIEMFPKYRELLRRELGEIPRIPAFQQLAVIYEKARDYESAIDVCESAIQYGLQDGTKLGFGGRVGRLRKKQGVKG